MKTLLVLIFFITGFIFINSCKSTSETDALSKHNSSPMSTQRQISSEETNSLVTVQNANANSIQTFTNKKPGCALYSGSATVLMYHRFDEEYESTSIELEKFNQQMQFFKEQGYSIVPISTIISAVTGSIPFGEKWIAITIDDAYKSFLKAKRILEKFNYPYTIFVNTKAVDQGHSNYMSWNDLKQITESNLGELAAHTHTHAYLVRDLTTQERRKEIMLSVKKIYENTGILPRFFSYPYGETSKNLINEVKNLQEIIAGEKFYFLAAFSTQSGPVGCSSDLFSLPRFAMNERYGVINDLFKIKISSLHLPVYDVFPENKSVCVSESIDELHFSTADFSVSESAGIDLQNLSCYGNRGNSVTVHISDNTVKLKLKNALGAGLENTADVRERVNCTLHDGTTNRFFWYGQEFTLLDHSSECTLAE